MDVVEAGFAGPADGVVEHLALDVEDLHTSLLTGAIRHVERVVPGPGTDFENGFPGSTSRISRSRSRVMIGWGAWTTNRWLYGQADGFLRQKKAAPATTAAMPASAAARRLIGRRLSAEADAWCGCDRADEDDLLEVDRDDALVGLEVGQPSALSSALRSSFSFAASA